MEINKFFKRFFKYELTAAIVCILIPFILIIGQGEALESISAYAYSRVDFIFCVLLTLGATLITTIGIKKNQTITWILGLNLMLIPLTPHLSVPVIHLVVSIIFFGGMAIHIIKYSDRYRKFRWFLVGIIATSFGLYYFTNIISLFAVESIGLCLFGINFLADIIADRKEFK